MVSGTQKYLGKFRRYCDFAEFGSKLPLVKPSKSYLLTLFSLISMMLISVPATAGFVMFSAYNLGPYSTYYEDTVMDALVQTEHSGIVYATIQAPHITFNETAYNQSLYNKANSYGANLWLQLRLYDNGFGFNSKNLIQANPWARNQLFPVFDAAVTQYASSFSSGDCKIILFEEAGIYHQLWTGGEFWAGGNQYYTGVKLSVSTDWDKIFVYRFATLFNQLYARIKTLTGCDVGFHIGHAALYRGYNGKTVIEHIFDQITTDFVLYDLYPMASPSYASYEQKMTERIPLLAQYTDVYYLNQMHTMNNFQNGGGRAPSAEIMRDSTDLAFQLGAKDVGWYGKNAQAAQNSIAFDPNSIAQETVLESSPYRYFYALGLTSR